MTSSKTSSSIASVGLAAELAGRHNRMTSKTSSSIASVGLAAELAGRHNVEDFVFSCECRPGGRTRGKAQP